MRYFKFAILLSALLVVTYAQSSNDLDLAPTQFSNYLQDSFSDYLKETEQWLRDNRVFRGNDTELEIAVNSPFERRPSAIAQGNSKGVLLIHGLSDSPYSFSDIAQRLSDQGLLVRTLLLPGHGGKPSDLMLPTIEDWLALLHHHTKLLAQEVDEVWLGGFSTGANLALIEVIDNKNVAGTLLFSPAIVSRKPLDFLAPLAKYLIDWADIDPEENITRFDSLTMNGAALYYESSKLVRKRLASNGFDRPVFVTLSEHDSVVDGEAIFEYFRDTFHHPNNQLVWFGQPRWEQSNVHEFKMVLPDKRISTGSHMSVLYSHDNPLYGEEGSIRICNNGQTEADEASCRSGAETWYSSFDYTEADKIHARLTWNPYFEETLNLAVDVMESR